MYLNTYILTSSEPPLTKGLKYFYLRVEHLISFYSTALLHYVYKLSRRQAVKE